MKFHFNGTEIDTDSKPFNSEGLRGLFAAFSGHGKSYTVALVVEQWLDQGGTVVIFEPIAEWHTLKQKYPIQVVGGPHAQDIPLVESEPELYAKAVVEKGISMVFYTRDIHDQEKLVDFVCKFIDKLMRLEELHHRPILILLEEAHEYAPTSAKGQLAPPWVYNRMIKVFVDCYTQGRKLNLCPISATQRPQLLNFTIRQQCNFVWFGKFSPQDANYIDKEVLKSFRERGHDITGKDLVSLEKGEWFLVAGDQTKKIKITDKRKTPHGADTPKLDYVAPVDSSVKAAVSSLGETLKEMIQKHAEELSEHEQLKKDKKNLEERVERLQEKVKLGVDLKDLFKGGGGAPPEEYERKVKQIQVELEEVESTLEFICRAIEAKNELIDQLREKTVIIETLKTAFTKLLDLEKPEPTIEEKPSTEKPRQQRRQRIEKPSTNNNTRLPPWTQIWMDKLNTTQRKVLTYIAEKYPLEMTRFEIAVGAGYRPTTGPFRQSLSILTRANLIKKIGKDKDTRYKLVDGPPV